METDLLSDSPKLDNPESIIDGEVQPPKFGNLEFSSSNVPRLEDVVTTGQPPRARFSFCSITVDEKFYVWGGRFDQQSFDVVEPTMHMFNFRTSHWTRLKVKAPRSLTGATPVEYGGKIWVWGGYSRKYHNAMFVYDPTRNAWSDVVQKGDIPMKRWHYSASVYNKKMYIFGGTFDQTHHDDLHVFDFETLTWSKLVGNGATNSPRRRHRTLVWKDKLYIFGGKEDSDPVVNLLVYDITNKKWENITTDKMDLLRGTYPPSAHDHSLYLPAGSDEVYIFGCRDEADQGSRVMKFNLENYCWIPVVPNNYLSSNLWEIPSHHGNAGVYKDEIYFFGGRGIHSGKVSNSLKRFVFKVPESRGVKLTEAKDDYSSLAPLLAQPRDFSNVQFIVEGKKIYADRCILWARCEYFRSLFGDRFKEGTSKNLEIRVEDCSYKVFYAFLLFLYTKELWIPPTDTETLQFIKQADMYRIEPLIKHCAKLLCNKLSLGNVIMFWQAACLYNLQRLRELCLNHIVLNFGAFQSSGKYNELLDQVQRKRAPGPNKSFEYELMSEIGIRLAQVMSKSDYSPPVEGGRKKNSPNDLEDD